MIEVQKFDDISQIRDAWAALNKENKDICVYQSLKYNELIMDNINPYRLILRMTPVFFAFSEHDKPILIVPLFKSVLNSRYSVFGSKAGGGYLDFIYGDTLTADKLAECLRILRDRYGIRNIYVSHVRSTTVLGRYAVCNGAEISETPCSAILLPEKYEDYYGSLSKNTRQNIRTAYNRLNKDGMRLDFECSGYEYVDERVRRDLLRIYINRQTTKYRRIGKVLYEPFVKYIDIGTKAEECRGLEKVFLIRINGEIAAFFDAICDRAAIIVPRLSIVGEYDRYSPGVILINESIRWLLSNSEIRKIDLTHGAEKYKLAMGATTSECVDGCISLGSIQ